MVGRRALLGIIVVSSVGVGAAQAQPPSVPEARIAQSTSGARLTAPSSAGALSILGSYLRSRGHSEATVRSMALVSENRVERTGVTHLRLEQRSGTLAVYGVYVKASLTARGELISVIENLVPIPAASAVQAQVGAAHALGAALRHLYGDAIVPPGLARREGDTEVFARTPFFHKEPRVTPVAVPRGDGLLGVAYLVETWSQKGNLLHHTLVGGGGEVRGVENRTANDSYKVFRVYPGASGDGDQATVQGGTGWLFTGDHTTVNIGGNNVRAYLDTDANNAPDSGGTAVTNGEFLTDANLSAAPGTTDNRAVSVQNLFYLNNVIHDRLKTYGFDESAGNFQEDNGGAGGVGSDSVNAEAQDGSGTDNANFATPVEGSNPRMQMYLWSGFGTHEVAAGGITYKAMGAAFGPASTAAGRTGPLATTGVAGNLACSKLTRNSLLGKVAIVDRGTCDFVVKVKNVQNAGAIAAIIVNNAAGLPFTMGGTGNVSIPAVMVGQNDGAVIKTSVDSDGTVRLASPAPLMRDSALDSDIVWHEYGHGLTWRMIGGMSGAMAGAIGEGMGDVLAILINEDDRVGEYAASDPGGIRSVPYGSYNKTYETGFTATEVHADGELYAAIGWRLLQNFGAARKDDLLTYMVDGMNSTPATPTFEQMRDGILTSVTDATDECKVWDAFADFGVGVGAKATLARRGTWTITESFARPAGCSPIP
jgi:extracellular elastinolytic metalloproteinase